MFSQTITKLTILYLGIIMAICLIFSVPIYQLSVNELNHSLRLPQPVFNILRDEDLGSNIRNQVAQEYEYLYQHAKQRILNRLILVNLLILAGGGFVSYFLARRTLQPIEEAHQRMARFTADASHELRTPITAMQTENEVTLMDRKLTLAGAKTQIKSNVEELQKLTRLSEGLLRLAHLENDELPKQKLSAGKLLGQAVSSVVPLAKKKGITIEKNAAKVSLEGDGDSLVEALVILLDNAIKYSPKGSKVTADALHERGCVVFKIKDEGMGIPKAEQERVFERFYRTDASRTQSDANGYGLGLAIAKNIVSAHRGNISVSGQKGKGSVFSIKLPAA